MKWVENEYEIKTGIELDGKFYELTQKYKEISAENITHYIAS